MPRQPMGKKPPMNLAALKKALIYAKRYWPWILVGLVFAIAASVCTIIGPQRVDGLVKEIQKGVFDPAGVNMDAVGSTAVGLLVLYGTAALLSFTQGFISATVTQHMARRLRKDIDAKINVIPLSYFDTTTHGDILSTVTNDVDYISEALASAIASLLESIVLFVGVIIMVFVTNWVLALVTLGTSILGFFVMGIVMKFSQKHFNRKQADLARMNGHIEEVFTNYKIVRLFGGKAREQARFSEANNDLFRDNWKSQSFNSLTRNFMNFIGNLTYVLIFIVGASYIANNDPTVDLGTIMAFVIYSKLLSQPLSTFAQTAGALQQSSAASLRIFALLGQTPLPEENEKLPAIPEVRGEVRFENVRFGYVPETEIIHGFSASVKPGQKVAIVGPTGAGKTTLVNLLMRFYEVNEGNIFIDGVSIADVRREGVHDVFDMILQDTWLFAGTLRENLVFNKEGVTDEELDKACKAVGLRHFVDTLPQRYETVLSDNLNLSEGQKQQLTIARAMIKNSPLLILDEATSSVDTRTEIRIQRAMDEITKGRTCFVIAHRLSTIRDADLILVLNQGDVIEMGTHESLLEKHGFYYELYNAQFAV